MSTLTSTLNDLEMNLDAIEDMMESMARILGTKRADDDKVDTDEDTMTAPKTP